MKNLLIIIGSAAVVTASVIAVNGSEPKSPTPDQIKAIKEMEERDRYREMPDCEGEFVTLEMGDVKLRVRRGGQSIHSDVIGKLHGLEKPASNYNCQDVIQNVTTYRVGSLTKGARPNQSINTSYKSINEHFKRHDIKLKRILREDGVEHLQVLSENPETLKTLDSGSKAEYFILPKDKVLTYTGEPILYECSISPHKYQGISTCNSQFYHPNGLYLAVSRQPKLDKLA